MDIEKNMLVAAPIDQVWRMLLDPKVMAGCVPGVQSVRGTERHRISRRNQGQDLVHLRKLQNQDHDPRNTAAALLALRGNRRGFFRCKLAEADDRDISDRAARRNGNSYEDPCRSVWPARQLRSQRHEDQGRPHVGGFRCQPRCYFPSGRAGPNGPLRRRG